MRKHLTILVLLAVLVLLATSCAPAATPTPPPAPTPTPAPKGPVVVSSKNFTEQYLLSWMTVLALEDAGFTVGNQIDLGGTVVNREALEAGEVDLYWEYTGTAWMVHLGHEESITDPQEIFDKVAAEDAAKGLIWLDYAPFDDTYTLMMTKEAGEQYGVKSLSDLGAYLAENPNARLCSDMEWTVRPDGYPAMAEAYGFEFNEDYVTTMEIGVTYKALRDGECDVAMGFATDGRIAAWGFFNLEDDKHFFPIYNPAPVVRKEVLDEYPEIKDVLAPIAAALDTETMTQLNALVDVGADNELDTGDEQDPQDVACNFLLENNLIESCGD